MKIIKEIKKAAKKIKKAKADAFCKSKNCIWHGVCTDKSHCGAEMDGEAEDQEHTRAGHQHADGRRAGGVPAEADQGEKVSENRNMELHEQNTVLI